LNGLTIVGKKDRNPMDGNNRKNISKGSLVGVVQKPDQRTGNLTRGRVKDILTKSPFHPHGIKLRFAGYEIYTAAIPAAITPKNRLLMGAPGLSDRLYSIFHMT
jgi:uncharacterized repeat protein (TIGR03833 family)